MNKVFRVRPNMEKWRAYTHAVIDGKHEWYIPNVECPVCGWLQVGSEICYPYISASSLTSKHLFNGIKAVSQKESETGLEIVKPLLPKGVPAYPGAALDKYRGNHKGGRLEDFYFYYGLRLVSASAFKKLQDLGILSIGATPAEIRPRKKGETVNFVELHVVPRARLAVQKVQKKGQKYCSTCGFDQRSLPAPLTVFKASIPECEDLFQLVDEPGVILATEKFVNGVISLGFSGLEFEEIVTCIGP